MDIRRNGAGFYAISLEPLNTITLRPTSYVVTCNDEWGEKARKRENEREREERSLIVTVSR